MTEWSMSGASLKKVWTWPNWSLFPVFRNTKARSQSRFFSTSFKSVLPCFLESGLSSKWAGSLLLLETDFAKSWRLAVKWANSSFIQNFIMQVSNPHRLNFQKLFLLSEETWNRFQRYVNFCIQILILGLHKQFFSFSTWISNRFKFETI